MRGWIGAAVLALLASLPARAEPVSYGFEGVLGLGEVGSQAQALAARLSPAAFGAFSATIVYDASTLHFSHDIYLGTSGGPVLVGQAYGVVGSATLTLADGTTLAAQGLQQIQWNAFAPGGPSFSVGADFSIPQALWLDPAPPDCGASSNPVCWLPAFSSLSFGVGGSWTPGSPPTDTLDGVTGGFVEGLIRADLSHDGQVAAGRETIGLTGSVAPPPAAVPEPSVLALLALALPLLGGSRASRRLATSPSRRRRPA